MDMHKKLISVEKRIRITKCDICGKIMTLHDAGHTGDDFQTLFTSGGFLESRYAFCHKCVNQIIKDIYKSINENKNECSPVLFREHRGSLSESMKTVVEVSSILEIKNLQNIPEKFYGENEIKVTKLSYDDRIKWDSYIVALEGYGVVGFTNGLIK